MCHALFTRPTSTHSLRSASSQRHPPYCHHDLSVSSVVTVTRSSYLCLEVREVQHCVALYCWDGFGKWGNRLFLWTPVRADECPLLKMIQVSEFRRVAVPVKTKLLHQCGSRNHYGSTQKCTQKGDINKTMVVGGKHTPSCLAGSSQASYEQPTAQVTMLSSWVNCENPTTTWPNTLRIWNRVQKCNL